VWNPCTGCLTHAALLVAVAEYHDPATFQEVMELDFTDEWHDVCQYEMDALAKNGTWNLVDLPMGCKAMKSKWVSSGKQMDAFAHD
jgi:hypothetical protein